MAITKWCDLGKQANQVVHNEVVLKNKRCSGKEEAERREKQSAEDRKRTLINAGATAKELSRIKRQDLVVASLKAKEVKAVTKKKSGLRKSKTILSGISAKQRKAKVVKLLALRGDRCCFCFGALGNDITIEHLLSLSRHGTNDTANLFLAHMKCNQAAGDRSVEDKIKIMTKAALGK